MSFKNLIINYLHKLLKKFSFSVKIQFLIFGIASTLWFLMRVVPKPSRAGYPCVRAAAPVASAFVMYLISLTSSVVFFRRFNKYLKSNRISLAALFFTLGLVASTVSLLKNKSYITAAETPLETANTPIGVAKGINPGRVVWVYNPDATNAACSNTFGDGYFMDTNTNQEEVDRMLEEALKKLTGDTTLTGAWDAVFKYHNQTRGKGNVGYNSNESIFIKINATSTWSENISSSFERIDNGYYATSETSPQVVLAVLRQLVNKAGVPESMIYVGDPMKHIYQDNYTKWYSEFPNVHYLDHSSTDPGREKATKSKTAFIKYSDRGTVLHEGSWSNSQDGDPVLQDTLYSIFENMEYMINIPNLKAHERAGVSMFGKNHFGSHTRDDAKHLHGGLVHPNSSEDLRNTYGLYRVQVDLMAHKLLGKKNLFYLMDALYCSDMSTTQPSKWQITPFDNDWTSSIFLSQDPVAIESVGFDFLYAQYDGSDGLNNYPHMGAVDDYLHQLADSTQWPVGIVYDPENDGTSIGYSQGTHEHWNNATEKKYSRNLGTGSGIELIQDFMSAQTIPVVAVTLNSENLTLVSGETSVLTATISPLDATDQTVNWSSSNTAVATVDTNGTVTAIAAGNATITATTGDGNKTASCNLLVYCAAKGTNASSYYINSVNIGTYSNVSGSNSGYARFTDQPVNLIADSSYNITLCTSYSLYYYYKYWRIYIDLNRNGSFADAGELIYDPGSASSKCNTGIITMPSSVSPGKTLMRVMWKYTRYSAATPCETFTYGEVEDYEINISTSDPIPVTSVTLNQAAISLTPGQTSTLTATISPTNATNQSVIWSSGDPSIATVSSSGVVSAVATGSTNITVTTVDGGKTATCSLTVSVSTNLALNKTATSSSDEDEGLTANYAIDGEYGSRWSSAFSDPQWIYVDLGASYNVTRVKLFWEAAYATSYKVQVSSDATTWTDVYSTTTGDGATDDLSITTSSARYVRMYGTVRSTSYGYSLYEFEVYGDTIDTQAPTAPTGLNSPSQTQTSISLAWTASTDNVGVTGYDIYKDGAYTTSVTTTSCTIESLVAGTTYTFTVKAKDAAGNYSAASNALTLSTLVVPVTGVTLSSSSLSLTADSTATLIATVSPSDATNQSISWTSSNTDVVTVSSSGVVTAVDAGTATITVTTADGGKTASCEITVTIPVTGVTLSPTDLSLTPGETSTLTAIISPSNATDKTIIWSSSNTNVATVDANGTVAAIVAGTTTITVTTQDGNKTAACEVNVIIPVTGVTLSSSSLSLAPGETSTLTATILPTNATDQTVSWSSGNTGIATVDGNGMVTAVAEGSTIVTITTQDGGITATCEVTVAIPVTGVTLSATSLLLIPDETFVLTATISPSDATDQSVSWSSGNSNIATVDASGIVTAVALGTVTITVNTLDGNKKDSCVVTVTDTIPVTGVVLTPISLSLTPGETSTLTANISPLNATDKTVSWTSDNINVATVDANGTVTAVGAGTTTVKVTTQNGSKTATCTVTVTVPVTGVTLNSSSLSLTTGQTSGLTATVSPANATNQSVTWSSSNTSVASVNNSGVVTAISEGSAIITVTTDDGGKTASCIVTVTVAVTNVSLSSTSLSMHLGGTSTLIATVSPENATNQSVTWSSSNTSVVTVSNSGVVTAISEGSAIITVTTDDGGKTASCEVTVSATIPVTGVALNTSFLAMASCQTSSLTATVSPVDATNKTVLWTSDNTSIATVDATGMIKGIATGIANITATTEDGGQTASCEVSVTAQTLTGISDGVSGTITCKNSSVTLSTLSDTSYTNYQWSGPNNFSSTVKSPSTSVPGIYTLVVNDTVNNCTVTAITNVLQNTLKPDARASSNGTLSCGTKAVSLKVTTSSANTVVTWDGQTIGANPVTMEWPGTYFVTTKDTVNGCTKRDSVTVNQYITYNSTQFYNNTFSTYSNGTTSDNNTNGWSLTTSGFTTTYVSNTTQKYFAVYSSRVTAQQLGSEGIWTSKVMDVSGKPNFQIGVKISTEGTLTSSDYVKLYYKLDGGSEILWDSRTGSIGTVDFRSPLLNANTVQIVVKLYTTLKGTSTVSNHYIEQYQLYIQDCGYPLTIYSSASGDINCANPSVTLHANSSHAGAMYEWSGPNSYTSTEQYPVISVPGTYTVTASMPTTADPSLTSSTATGTVTISQNVTNPGASIDDPDTISSQNKYVTLFGTSPTTDVYYSWEGPDNFASNQQQPIVTSTGTYTLTVINPVNGCFSSASTNVVQNSTKSTLLFPIATTPDEYNKEKEKPALVIYPNPANDMLFIKTTGVSTVNSIKIIDIRGKIICVQSAGNGLNLDISTLNNGLYILIVETEKCIFREKFIKQ